MVDQKIPKGRLGRLARLAKVGLQTGRAVLGNKDATLSAMRSAEVLGQLRGLATKVGQMASYVDGLVPEEHREAFENGMSKLQAATPTSEPAEVRALLEEELGRSLDECFATWEATPLASASIGQVHRATLHSGEEVVVKVQHPGIGQALEADLANASLMERAVFTFAGDKFESKRLLEEVKQRFREELDYNLEAERQTQFAQIHADKKEVHVPAVFEEFSAKRVLTSEFVSGIGFKEASEANEDERRAWCETLWHFVYKSNLMEGLFNADPHPGNYIFQPNGRVGFLDFGCVQPVPPKRRAIAQKIHLAARQRDEDAFSDHCREMLGLRGGDYERLALSYTRDAFRPLFESPFRLTPSYTATLVQDFKDMANHVRKSKEDTYVAMPEGLLFINRLQFGFFSVLSRLDAEVDYAAVEAQYLTA